MSAADEPASVADDPAVLLVAHGSPDPDWRRPLEQLCATLGEALGPRVALAYLAQDPKVDAVIAELVARGHGHVIVIAALLSPGGRHVKRDIPAVVEAARAAHPTLRLELVSGALGDDPGVIAALTAATISRLPPSLRRRPSPPDR